MSEPRLEDIFPDIEAFTPWNLDDQELDARIAQLHDELKKLNGSERNYKIDLVCALDGRVRHQKMCIWSRNFQKAA